MHQALYRKWRPQYFDDVIAQDHITSTLKHELSSGKTSHAYLFTGSRGTGKTTCAKIFSKAVNCQHPNNGEPCGECLICKGLEDSSILDVVEMDGASNNSVNDVRILREEAGFTPVCCKYRVYIIDEAHMLSTSAFNALLKIMEEPPEHVIFILATTEVHKIPATIVSRCQKFNFRRIRSNDIAQRLMYIAQQEAFSLDQDAAIRIAQLADGAMRDALSLLEQCSSLSNAVTMETVVKTVGIAGEDYLGSFYYAIRDHNAIKALNLTDQLYADSKELQRLCDELIVFFRNVMLCAAASGQEHLLDTPLELTDRIKEASQQLSLRQIFQIIEMLQLCSERLSSVANPRLEFEVCLLRLCLPEKKDERKTECETSHQVPLKLKQAPPINDATPIEPEIPLKKSEEISPQTSTQESETSIVPIDCWTEILEDLRDQDQTGMLSGFLENSTAFTSGNRLFIDSIHPIVNKIITDKKDMLDAIIFQHLGKRYRILMKKVSEPSPANSNNILEQSLEKAKQVGIEIEEE